MPLKILCAGCSKDEKADLESEVRKVFSTRPAAESWSISLVKLGGRFSVSVDGPDQRLTSHSLSADRGDLRSSLKEMLVNAGFEEGGGNAPSALPFESPSFDGPFSLEEPSWAAPTPAPPPPSRPSAPSRPAAPAWSGPAPVAPVTAKPAPRPSPAGHQGRSDDRRPRPIVTPPMRADEGRDTHTCPACTGRFVVTYEALPNEPKQLVAVACPHCWEVDRVEVAEGAAIARTYRADKAP